MNDIQSRPKIRKPKRLFFAGACWFVVAVLAVDVSAQEIESFAPVEFGISAGWYEPDRPEAAAEFGFDVTINRELFWGIRSQLGFLVTSDESLYAYSGFRYTVPFFEGNWRVDIHSALGAYERGDGKELGGTAEFRSGIDLMRKLSSGNYMSLSFHHISNAGIYNRNPGSNSLLLRYVFGKPRE